MRHFINEKFRQHPALAQKLVASGQCNLIEATLDPFWGAKAVPSSKSLKNGTWTGANMLGKILAETRDELRRELGLSDTSMEVSNAPPVATKPSVPTPAPEAEGGVTHDNQAGKQTAALPVFDNNKPNQALNQNRDVSSQAGLNQSQTNPSRKNKNHQSPIASTGDSPAGPSAKTKKQRLFSPKTALPPKNFSALGSLFACPAINEDPASVAAAIADGNTSV